MFGMVKQAGAWSLSRCRAGYGFTLRQKIGKFADRGSTIYTDDYVGYSGVEQAYQHHRINHTERVYVEGDVHTQTIEGFFSLVKNGIRGVYRSVSPKWLQSYLNGTHGGTTTAMTLARCSSVCLYALQLRVKTSDTTAVGVACYTFNGALLARRL